MMAPSAKTSKNVCGACLGYPRHIVQWHVRTEQLDPVSNTLPYTGHSCRQIIPLMLDHYRITPSRDLIGCWKSESLLSQGVSFKQLPLIQYERILKHVSITNNLFVLCYITQKELC